ncbi:hypothetical protein BGZ63DRAFT_434144 [Mariannaea sp. PMI_226]|nr:hypothetical protein BGZ63DRAFT_434144 [Mariannaea sp. PMI_226]
MTNLPDPVKRAFDNAIHRFKADLKDAHLYDQILQTTSIEQVYDATDQLQKEQVKTGHLRHLSKIEPFLRRLTEYSAAIEVFMQLKPDILALLWGPVKLLLQWANVMKQSFDAIVDTIENIGLLMPEFCQVTRIFTDNIRLQEVLVLFFRDILDFYLISIKFFSLSRLKIVFEMLWPSRRDKISIVAEHIGRHALLMRNEVRLEEIRQANDAREQQLKHFALTEENAIRQEYFDLRAHISPKDYDADLYRFHGDVYEGTGKWLFRDQSFKDWVDQSNTSERLLWLKGIPGAGKTLLASSIIRHTQSINRTLFAFLTYKDSSTSALSIFHSLIFQLASDSITLQTALSQSSRQNLRSSLETATELLQMLLKCAGVVYVIIDGIDEIKQTERSRLLRKIIGLSEACEDCRIILSSRSEADISTILKGKTTDIQVDQRNSGSIQAFINCSTEEWFAERDFISDVRNDIRQWLAPMASRAKGEAFDSVDEIHNELENLPDSLDDAYGRILMRINSSTDKSLKNKARKILGWVGCAPSPMTRRELEQALVVNPVQADQQPRVVSKLDVVNICGPIVEVVDEYVQFVHFTVKEYIFSPNIVGFIPLPDMALSLAICCINYLCQDHHDIDDTEDEIGDGILKGTYRLHNFASAFWLQIIEQYMALKHATTLPDSLIDQLKLLHSTRTVMSYEPMNQQESESYPATIAALKPHQPEVADMLCNVFRFQHASSQADYHLKESDRWIHLDPLTISKISIKLQERFDGQLCKASRNKQVIGYHYGANIFKCGFLQCKFHRHGFDTKASRHSHEKYHSRPWKCDIPDCEYANIGFVSRNMRDHHLQTSHRAEDHCKAIGVQKPDDDDEIQPLLFDLVQANKVEAVRALCPYLERLENEIQLKLATLAASTGSSAMLQIFCIGSVLPKLLKTKWEKRDCVEVFVAAIRSRNVNSSEKLVALLLSLSSQLDSRFEMDLLYSIVPAVIETGSMEMCKTWKPIFNSRSNENTFLFASVYHATIESTGNNTTKEGTLLAFWEDNNVLARLTKGVMTELLSNIARSTCSIYLARHLLMHGFEVDGRRTGNHLTPLHWAAKQTTERAARFMEFLLLHGADPNKNTAKRKIEDEKGALRISAWLGVSWHELVERTRREREQQGKGSS